MKTVVRNSRTLKISLAALIFAVLSACAVEGGGYGGGYGGDVGVGVGYPYPGDYYEPCCYGYGGWGGGYRVGPPRGYGGHDDHRGPGHSAPSIPSHSRGGGGGHAGGAHGGAHGGGGGGGGRH